MTNEAVIPPKPRLVALDGLRGLAALIVLLHHLSLLHPPIAATYLAPRSDLANVDTWSLDWWVTSSPAQLILAGPQAVLVFFALSGLVVALPVLNRPGFSWWSYYPQRLTRLYLPAAVSVLLAVVLLSIAQAFGSEPSGTVASSWSVRNPTWQQVIGAFDLIFGDTSINNPLWTLRWEAVFSVFLPLFVVVAVITRRHWVLLALGTTLVAIVSAYNPTLGAFKFLSVFLLGTLVAVKLKSIQSWAAQPTRRRLVFWTGLSLLLISVVTTTLHATSVGLLSGKFRIEQAASSIEFIGCVGFVLVAAFWEPAIRLLSRAPFQWLGRISFSLYLVHIPVIAAVDTVAGPGHELLTVLLSLVLSFVFAEVFMRLIEMPSHHFSKRIGSASASAMSHWFSDSRAAELPALSNQPSARGRTPLSRLFGRREHIPHDRGGDV